ncbi:hypothetical protein QTP81_17165 [Alteromonas sp. ASW11-36]|uniref:Phosphate ABC transporter substrate-binding protein n=1 Tax=Alteromonas arenosi TaxID=3055817 RepID=A0ABT7T1L2_9ALTE|nr:hypothetical protein [Alteromonas sp. ASW11-36]MDM7862341.1 hypothetical protein [Alteromonas sp. ASW11-36]
MPFAVAADASDSLVVVVHAGNAIEALSKKQVIDIYMGRYSSFPNGQPAAPIDFPDESVEKALFYQLLVNQDLRKIRSYWSRLLFSGRAKPPRELETASEIAQYLDTDINTLAYVPRSQVTTEMKIVYQFDQQ